MLKGTFPVEKFKQLPVPFYYYDTKLLQDMSGMVKTGSRKYGYHIYYAMEANANPRILSIIMANGLGTDCVGGGEAQAALDTSFPADKIIFTGVDKANQEINLGLDSDIFCFNMESAIEPEIINELTAAKSKVASITLRISPEMDAHTHTKITTDMRENKFGISLSQLGGVLDELKEVKNVRLIGIYSHISSQVTDVSSFRNLAIHFSEIQEELETHGATVKNLGFGGGLGIDYYHPNHLSIPASDNYFAAIHKLPQMRPDQQVHFEPGRSIVAQCRTLISKVLYVKEGETEKFAILDAGFTELIRPAMYDAYHRIENVSSDKAVGTYGVMDPICESSDVFGKDVELNKVHHGDLITLRPAGAYDEIMTSQYNYRYLPKTYCSDMIGQ